MQKHKTDTQVNMSIHTLSEMNSKTETDVLGSKDMLYYASLLLIRRRTLSYTVKYSLAIGY